MRAYTASLAYQQDIVAIETSCHFAKGMGMCIHSTFYLTNQLTKDWRRYELTFCLSALRADTISDRKWQHILASGSQKAWLGVKKIQFLDHEK